jgi:hypothetical protein
MGTGGVWRRRSVGGYGARARAEAVEGLGEEGEGSGPGVVLGLGIAAVVVGAATLFVPVARYGAVAILGTVFGVAYSGEIADDVLYESIAGVALLLLGLLALIGHRGAR